MFIKRRRYNNLILVLRIFRPFLIVLATIIIIQTILGQRSTVSSIRNVHRPAHIINETSVVNSEQVLFQNYDKHEPLYINLTQWTHSLCSAKADHRGRHQKILTYSIFGPDSRKFENEKFTWNKHIELLEPVVLEAAKLFPDWIIRLYVDFTGSSEFHRQYLSRFSNVDVCDMRQLPVFGSSLLDFLPGRMWRFLCVFDPLVDFVLSRDLDSPLIERDQETIELWTSSKEERTFFHIIRDHPLHGAEILAGLWGAAPSRDRRTLFDLFYPMLKPSLSLYLGGAGDQSFLSRYVWPHVRYRALTFDSYLCQLYGGQPFLSRRPSPSCFVGCYRPCCNGSNVQLDMYTIKKPCPVKCRPPEHIDWEYC